MKRLNFGDIIEIPTSMGLSYAIFTHRHQMYGYLIRVFTGFYKDRPESLSVIFGCPLQMTCFFPLGAAINRGIFKVAGNLPIPSELRAFPLFRAPKDQDLSLGKVFTWWLWDGATYRDIGKLTEEQKKIPMTAIINDTLLIQRIEGGWTPQNDALTNR